MFKKYYREDSNNYCAEARTLLPEYIGNNKSGWVISGTVHEDYYEWVNSFEAYHPTFGIVFGDFEDVVFYSSEKALEHFLKNHHYESWDYYDI